MRKKPVRMNPIVLIIANSFILINAVFFTLFQNGFSQLGMIASWVLLFLFMIFSIGLWLIDWTIIYASVLTLDMFIIIIGWPPSHWGSIAQMIIAMIFVTITPHIYKKYILYMERS